MKNAYLYDMKRSMFNRTLLIMLVVLIAAGLGLGYLVARYAVTQSQDYYAVSEPLPNGSQLCLLLSPTGAPMGNVTVFYYGITGQPVRAVTNSTGFLVMTSRGFGQVTAEIDGRNVSFIVTELAVVDVNLRARTAYLVFAVPSEPGAVAFRAFFYQSALTSFGRPHGENMTYLGEFQPGIWEVPIHIVLDKPVVNVVLEPTGPAATGNVSYLITVGELMARSLRSSALVESVSVFAEFFPLAGLFLVNDLFAGLRSSRAIEFVLARPITRLQLIMSRYLGGLVALLLSSLVTAVALAGASWLVFGESVGAEGLGVVLGSLVAALAGFYSLLYLVSVLTRRGFLVASILLYLVLYLFNLGEILSFITGRSWPLYMTPLSVASSIMGQYFGNGVFSIGYTGAVIAAVLWAVAPIAIAVPVYHAMAEP